MQRTPGIYFGLDEDDYHADKANGSTDIRKLAKDPENWWWDSRHNPNRDDDSDDSEAKMVGRAIHAAVLEGREALEARFAPQMHPGNIKAGKDEKAAIEAAGKTPIKFKAWKRIQIASAMVRQDPECGAAFTNLIGTEVSVFWTCEKTGMAKKCRFDGLKPRAIVDLKSITNRDGIDFEELCHRHIGSYGYFIQAAHYMDGWSQLSKLVDKMLVYGMNAAPKGTLERLAKAAREPVAAFVLVFMQKNGAPLVWGTQISPGNELLERGRIEIDIAADQWKHYADEFGIDTPWVTSRAFEECDINRIPAWAFRR